MQLILGAMASAVEHEDEHWDKVTESIDLLYAKMEVMDQQQQRVATQVDVGNKVMEQLLKDQQVLAKQLEVTRTGGCTVEP